MVFKAGESSGSPQLVAALLTLGVLSAWRWHALVVPWQANGLEET